MQNDIRPSYSAMAWALDFLLPVVFSTLVYSMTKSIKAAMLSALVFPGVGHFYLKKHIPGIILAGTALASLYFVISRMVERALHIAEQIQRGEVPLDVAIIAELVSRQPTGTDAALLNFTWTVLIISWFIGIADSYRVGRVQGKFDAAGG